MYFKIALQNVKKSYKDYLIYFLTLAFSVCLFFTFNSFQDQQAVMEMNASQMAIMESLSVVMLWLSGFIAVVLGFLILYANNFLIKRRKKEFGIYTLLGMPKKQISKILIMETVLIGIGSLIVGVLLGVLLSQVLVVITASLFAVTLNYRFVFSIDALTLTVVAFAIIFLITTVFNTAVLKRYKLIDLLYADRKNDTFKIKNVWLYVITFLASIACLALAYSMTWKDGLEPLADLSTIIPLGIIGTILFFYSLAGFLLRFVQTSKKLYYRKLNVFVLREVNSSIKSNFISMSVVCIMLLLSIGALSTGLTLNESMGQTFESMTPYDFSSSFMLFEDPNNGNIASNSTEIFKVIDSIEDNRILTKSQNTIYLSDVGGDVLEKASPKDLTSDYIFDEESLISAIKLSEYNKFLKDTGQDQIKLKKGEASIITELDSIKDDLDTIAEQEPTIEVFGKKLKIKEHKYKVSNHATFDSKNMTGIILVVNDDVIPETAKIVSIYSNYNLKEGADINNFKSMVENKTLNLDIVENTSVAITNIARDEVIDNNRGMSVVVTYIGIYLGIVFLLASAVILALQQLSKANDNKKRYIILSKIGADKKMIDHSILLQLGIYFMVPLFLAIIHSVVGIRLASNVVAFIGRVDIFFSVIVTSLIILLVYGSYFMLTYLGSKNIISGRN